MKKLVCSLSIVMLVLVLISPAAYAAVPDEVYAQVAAANLAIERRIIQAQNDANQVLVQADFLYRLAFTAGLRNVVDKLTDARLDNIIADLIRDTNRIANQTIRAAAQKGVTVVCTWVTVEIGGRLVEVDPLIVCNE